MPCHYSALLWTEPHEETNTVCVSCVSFFFCCMICRCIYQIQLLFFLQKNSLSRTLRLLRSLTRGMMLSSCVTSSALRHPQLSGNTREPRFSRKKTVRGTISAIFAVTSLFFFLLFFQWSTYSSNPTHSTVWTPCSSIFESCDAFTPKTTVCILSTHPSVLFFFCAIFSWIDLF